MHYRSDWPEIGLSSAISEQAQLPVPVGRQSDWIEESRADEFILRWVFSQDKFESQLYDFPIWNFRLESDDTGRGILHPQDSRLGAAAASAIGGLIASPRLAPSYLFSRVVKPEPLYATLLEWGFQEVEMRCIYRTQVGVLAGKQSAPDESIRFASLAEIAQDQRGCFREQIFELCAEAFRQGYSRHFTDPFLWARRPGLAYIVAAMNLNFERLDPDAFLLAVDGNSRLCGFSVVGKKPGLTSQTYTQLLSAVRTSHQDRRVYQGMTQFLVERLPRDAVLLNATHAGNTAMRNAYERSGRAHLADTVVMRRIIE